MKIRSITAFTPLLWPLDKGSVASMGYFLHEARDRFKQAGLEVQTIRLATPPFLDVIGDPDPAVLLEFAHSLETQSQPHQIDAISIGPVIASTPLALLLSIQALPQVIVETQKIYSGVLFAAADTGINISAASAFAGVVHKVAHSTPGGIGNFRLAALANIPPFTPYFPAAYHQGGFPCFAIATEAADLALDVLDKARTLADAAQQLRQAIEDATTRLLEVADELVDNHHMEFKGIDFSLAPFPAEGYSIGAAIERLGIGAFGGSGSLFVIKFLTTCIQEADFPRAGFCGVMLPVLEDEVLAQRVGDGLFTVNDLLLYSAVCGTGLDTVPIPGNTQPEEIAAIFLDMAALAVSVGKPLTARLLPVPGKAVGQRVAFDSEYLAASRVMPVKNMGAQQLIQRGSFFKVTPPKSRARGR